MQNTPDKVAKAAATAAERSHKTHQTVQNKVISDEVFMATESGQPMPSVVQRQFLKVGDRHWHFKKSPDDLAFIDKGNTLETSSDSHMVAETLVRVAQRRGWDEIRVTGSETFRREVWHEAVQRGMTVRGYTPTDVDKVKLAEVMAARNQTPADKSAERAQAYRSEPVARALEKTPELTGTFAARVAISNYLASTDLTEQERAIVLQQVDKRMEADLRMGHIPKIHKEEYAQELAQERSSAIDKRKLEQENERELER